MLVYWRVLYNETLDFINFRPLLILIDIEGFRPTEPFTNLWWFSFILALTFWKFDEVWGCHRNSHTFGQSTKSNMLNRRTKPTTATNAAVTFAATWNWHMESVAIVSVWWFQIYFICTSKIGEDPILTIICFKRVGSTTNKVLFELKSSCLKTTFDHLTISLRPSRTAVGMPMDGLILLADLELW